MKLKNGLYQSGNGKFWYLNGLYHREDGPAIEFYNSGKKLWCLDGGKSVLPDIFNRSLGVCKKCEFFVNTEKGWKWRKNYGVSVKRFRVESRIECKNCPRILEHTVMG
jgi:hypothetical protein